MATKQSTIRLHDDIRKEFQKMSDIKEYGVPKYTSAYIMNVIADKFYKSPKTIENIVFNRYPIKGDNEQLRMAIE